MEHKTLKLPKLNFSKDVSNYYPEILTEDALPVIATSEPPLALTRRL